MFRRIVPLGVLLVSISASAQVGIGTNRPDKSAMLDIESVDSSHYNGVLIPRIPLKNLHDGSLINNGKIANSLLVFNTTENNELTAGYYYWFDSMWVRLVTDNDNFDSKLVRNEELAVDPVKEVLYLRDTKGGIVDVPILDLNLITFITNDGNGKITFTNEEGVEYDINIPNEVIQNIQNIINNQDVQDTIMNVVNANGQELTVNGPIFIANPENAKAALLEPLELGIQEKGITTEFLGDAAVTTAKVADGAVTAEKLDGGNTGVDYRFAISDGSGKVTYSEFPLTEVMPDGEIVNLEGIIHVDHGEHSTFSNVELGINDHAIPVAKFDAENAPVGSVATVVSRGQLGNQVVYAPLSSESLQGGKTISTDGIIGITTENGEAVSLSDAVLKDFTLQINNQSITSDKLSSEGATIDDVLVSDGEGGATFKSAKDAFYDQGKTLSVDNSIAVNGVVGQGAEKTVLSNVKLAVAEGGIESKHLGDGAVTNNKIDNQAVTPDKIGSGDANENAILVADDNGGTKFVDSIDSNLVNGKAFSGDTIIAIANGDKAVLTETTVSVNPNSIDESKLKDGSTTRIKGNVLTTQGDGTVAYQALTSELFGQANTLNTDGIIGITDGQGNHTAKLENSVLKDLTLQINNQSITTDKLKGTNDSNQFLASDGAGGIQFQTLDSSGIDTYDLTSDNIIKITSVGGHGSDPGVNAVLEPIALSVNDGSINVGKLNSEGEEAGNVLISDGKGGFTYSTVDALASDGLDLTLGSALTFTGDSTGEMAVLVPTSFDVAEGGIETNHIHDLAVTTTKISSEGSATNDVLVSDGKGGVVFQSADEAIFTQGMDLTVDNSIAVNDVIGQKATGAVLNNTKIAVAQGGITTTHLADKAVTTAKISSVGSTENAFLVADNNGATKFVSVIPSNFISGNTLSGDNIIAVEQGENTLLSPASLSINSNSIDASKLKDDAANPVVGNVLTTQGNGTVAYQPLTTDNIKAGKTIATDNIIGIYSAGSKVNTLSNAVLKDFTLQVNDSSIGVGKLNSDGEKAGNVLISDGHGGFTYSSGEALGNTGTDLKLGSSLAFTGGSNGKGAVLVPTSLEVAANGIGNTHVQNGAITTDKISSNGKGVNNILVSDGNGGTSFQPVSTVVPNTTSDLSLSTQSGLTFLAGTTGKGAVNTPVNLSIAPTGVQTFHLADNAVIPSKIGSQGSPQGTVLVADGFGNASFKSLSEVGSSTPNFFYLPSVELQVAAGATFTENLYDDYVKQFGSPQVVSTGSSSRSLPVLQPNQLNFFVTYYDINVFQSVQIDQNGVMTYVVRSGSSLNLTNSSFMNIVVQVK